MTPPASSPVSSILVSTGGCIDFVWLWAIMGRKPTRPAQEPCVLRPTMLEGVFEIEKQLHHLARGMLFSPTLLSLDEISQQ